MAVMVWSAMLTHPGSNYGGVYVDRVEALHMKSLRIPDYGGGDFMPVDCQTVWITGWMPR